MSWVPNLLSISRMPLTVAAVYFRWIGNGPLAFTYLAIAVFTDFIDGAVARRLKAESLIGKKYIDPFCDGFMTITAGFGLALGPTGFWSAVPTGLTLVMASLFMKWLKHQDSLPKLKRFSNITLPFVYLVVITLILMHYAQEVSANDEWVWSTTAAGLLPALYFKRQRVIDWLSGRM
jgi:phosphatidylglycerophosphate synthase